MTLSNRNLRFGIFHKIRDTTSRADRHCLPIPWQGLPVEDRF
jgi:hypothetical protein